VNGLLNGLTYEVTVGKGEADVKADISYSGFASGAGHIVINMDSVYNGYWRDLSYRSY